MKYLRLDYEAILIGDKPFKIHDMGDGWHGSHAVMIVDYYGEGNHYILFLGTEPECQTFLDRVLEKLDHIDARYFNASA